MLKFTLGKGETVESPRGNDSREQNRASVPVLQFQNWEKAGREQWSNTLTSNPGLMHEGYWPRGYVVAPWSPDCLESSGQLEHNCHILPRAGGGGGEGVINPYWSSPSWNVGLCLTVTPENLKIKYAGCDDLLEDTVAVWPVLKYDPIINNSHSHLGKYLCRANNPPSMPWIFLRLCPIQLS